MSETRMSGTGVTSHARPGAFLITVDTEGDNLWAKPRTLTTRNAQYIPRFQSLCEKHGLRPTYLTNWEMVNCPAFVEFARDMLSRDAGEIGMHLHAWNSPPFFPLTDDDDLHAPYLIEYPEAQIREKVKAMTGRLEEVFGRKMLSHRAGRWSFNETYARILVEQGYRVDCSVTPHVSWQFCEGDPSRGGGSDFTHFPESAYFVDLNDISKPGNSPLLELPMTIVRTRTYPGLIEHLRQQFAGSFHGTLILRKLFPYHLWLMPNGRNLHAMLQVLKIAQSEKRPYIEMAIHSSEFMPAGSPTFPTPASIETLYDHLEELFSKARSSFEGRTLSEYHASFSHSALAR